MQPEWLRYRERGSVFAYRLIAWLARVLGRAAVRLLLYPICLYYMTFSRLTPRASRDYLTRVLGRPARWREVFRHHFYFASALLDRVYLMAGRQDLFDFHYIGQEALHRWLRQGRGCIMLSAHLGSFEFMRIQGMDHKVMVNMMMYRDNAQKVDEVMRELGGAFERRIIPVGPIDSLIVAKERADRGEVVGILGDRAVSSERYELVRFLGDEAAFPAGPFLTAAVLKLPVVLFFCLYRGGNRYELYFEEFADQVSDWRRDPQALRRWMQRYAERLEHYCRLDPYNWFNFYDFWRLPHDEAGNT
jgi:predicted LPLAT superfamily acyltransferase